MEKKKTKIFLAVLCVIVCFATVSAGAVTIENPFSSGDGYTVSGTGTPTNPYIIKFTDTNNFIKENGLNIMREKAPDAIWQAEHHIGERTDYILRFSTAITDSITPPLSLDVTAWQEEEGRLNLLVGERDSEYVPATLTLDVSEYSGFSEGTIITVTGGTNLRVPVKDGKVEFALDGGGDHLLTAAGYETPPDEIEPELPPSDEIWDKPNEAGKAISDDYVNAGSAQLPFNFDLSETGTATVDGASFNELKKNGQSRLLLWKDENGKILWSYLVESKRISKTCDNAMYDFATTFDGTAMTVAQNGDFPCKMSTMLYVGDWFSNASIVSIKGKNLNTAAVVDRGYITFWLSEGGTYTIADTGDTVSGRTVDDAKLISETSRDNMYTTQKYKGEGAYGSKDEPLTILGKLDDFFWASWRSINTVAGYSPDMNATEASYDPSTLMNVSIEYRSPVTGKLIASITIDGSEWRMTPESMKGPYYLDYKLNPSKAVIEKTLKSHSLYIGKYSERRESAVETLTALSESPDEVLFLMSRTRSFAGAINYKLDMSNYFSPGDIVHFQYLLGSCNGDLYHGEAPNNAELMMEEGTYSRYDGDYVVDSKGYISFPLYTGGFFVFTKTGKTANVDDGWLPGGGINGKDGGGGKSAVKKKQEITEESIKIEEEVSSKKHTETGVLTDVRADEQLKSPNFNAESNGVTATGYLSNPTVDFNASELSKTEGAKANYELSVQKSSGFTYKMIEGDYLDVTLNLGGGYSIHDESLLYVKCIENGVPTDEVFSAHSEISANGNMILTFRTSHLSEFAVFCAENKDELASAVSLKQEYASEATTLLAEQSILRNDAKKTMKYLLVFTLILLFAAVIISDIRRRWIK